MSTTWTSWSESKQPFKKHPSSLLTPHQLDDHLWFRSFRGPFSVVKKCYHKETRELYAVKIVDIERFISSPGLSIEGLLTWTVICGFFSESTISFQDLFSVIKISNEKPVYAVSSSICTLLSCLKHICRMDSSIWFLNSKPHSSSVQFSLVRGSRRWSFVFVFF